MRGAHDVRRTWRASDVIATIGPSPTARSPARWDNRQADREGRAGALRSLDFNRSPMLLDDVPRPGQPQTRPRLLADRVAGAEERLEDVGNISGRDTDAVVSHAQRGPAFGRPLVRCD